MEGTRNNFGGEINTYKILLEKSEGKRPNEGPRCGWKVKEIKCGRDSTGSGQGLVAGSSDSCDSTLKFHKS
jgi:hypothetical protein